MRLFQINRMSRIRNRYLRLFLSAFFATGTAIVSSLTLRQSIRPPTSVYIVVDVMHCWNVRSICSEDGG